MVARRHRRDRGFTIIELLVAMALSMVGLLGLVALQTIAIRGNVMSRNFGEAIGVTQQRLETVPYVAYSQLSTVFGTEPCPNPTATAYCDGTSTPATPDPYTTTQGIYSRCAIVTVDAVNNTTTILVRTCWSDSNGGQHKVELVAQRSP